MLNSRAAGLTRYERLTLRVEVLTLVAAWKRMFEVVRRPAWERLTRKLPIGVRLVATNVTRRRCWPACVVRGLSITRLRCLHRILVFHLLPWLLMTVVLLLITGVVASCHVWSLSLHVWRWERHRPVEMTREIIGRLLRMRPILGITAGTKTLTTPWHSSCGLTLEV